MKRPGWATELAHIKPARRLPLPSPREALRHVALTCAGSLARFHETSFLRCIYCHYVYDDQVEDFRGLLQRLQQVGRFIRTEDVVAISRGSKPLDGRYFHLSFDDGFDNLYRNALPVMSDLGIPSAIFVPSRFMGASDDEVLRDWWNPKESPRPTRPLRWSWLEETVRLGHDVGSHTRTHSRLSAISGDADRMHEEIAGSKDDLEQKLGVACRYFAWPWGTWDMVGERSLKRIEEAGYEACFSGIRGRVVSGETRTYAIPRHHFEPQWPWAHVRYFAAGGREGR